MTGTHWVELSLIAVAAFLVALVLFNPKTQSSGIGPWTVQAMTVTLGTMAVIVLALEGILKAETVAALLGSVLGLGIASKGSGDQK